MHKHLFHPNLNGSKLSGTLLLAAKIVFILGIVCSVLVFFLAFIGAISAAAEGEIGAFVLALFGGIFSGVALLISFYLTSLLLKGLASIVLSTYITALNSDKIADNTIPKTNL